MTESDDPERFILLLLDGFSLVSLSCVLEPLLQANHLLASTRYEWTLVSESGDPVTCSNGITFPVTGGLSETSRSDTVMVLGGDVSGASTSDRITGWLREQSLRGRRIVAMSSAPAILAEAGLLNGRSATISWDFRDSFREEHPDIDLQPAPYLIQNNIITVSGGIVALDLMLRLISERHGEILAHGLSRRLVEPRSDIGQQSTGHLPHDPRPTRHPKMAAVIRSMEDNTEEPLPLTEIARQENISVRQLERLFRRHLNRSPKRFYVELRLQKARNLLQQTDLPVIEVALACGFQSASHFSRWYKFQFGISPYNDRISQSRSAVSMVPGTIL